MKRRIRNECLSKSGITWLDLVWESVGIAYISAVELEADSSLLVESARNQG